MSTQKLSYIMAQRPCMKEPTLFHLNKSTGRFSSWIRRPSVGNTRHYIGCYTTFHMAARAQDRATLYIDSKAAVNFKASDYQDDVLLRTTMDEKSFLKMLRDESRLVYKVVAKSPCFAKFQIMEDHMEDLRGLTKFTLREFVAHLAENPSTNPEVNEAALTLLEIFSTPVTIGRKTRRAAPSIAELAKLAETVALYRHAKMDKILAIHTPKGKRSPRGPRMLAADQYGTAPPSENSNRPRTRAYIKRKLTMPLPTASPFKRSRS